MADEISATPSELLAYRGMVSETNAVEGLASFERCVNDSDAIWTLLVLSGLFGHVRASPVTVFDALSTAVVGSCFLAGGAGEGGAEGIGGSRSKRYLDLRNRCWAARASLVSMGYGDRLAGADVMILQDVIGEAERPAMVSSNRVRASCMVMRSAGCSLVIASMIGLKKLKVPLNPGLDLLAGSP